ncbi:MAG TPA: aspartyl-tRNA amidotransferase [Nitrospiraceae bacterium]|nr:aspartyl-tRNA amidotransferase [Nitrospiraceae bacterium]
MISLIQRFDDELKVALKASNKIKVSVLRMAKAAVKNKQIEKGGELTEDEVVAVLSSMVKQRRESVEQFAKAQRADLAAKEEEEIAILQTYLPQQLSHQELDRIILDALRESGAKNVQDIGKVMRILMPRIKGAADGKYVNQRVRELIESS